MINAVRTLLLNTKRNGARLTDPGEEYIPADFVPRILPPAIRRIRTALFGAFPDRLGLNYRMRQIMQTMHATPLAAHITRDDPRITYLPFKPTLPSSLFTTTLVQTAGDAYPASVTGEHVASVNSGMLEFSWTVELTAGIVTITDKQGRSSTTLNTPQDGVLLPGSGLRVFLGAAASGYKATVLSRTTPAVDFSTVLTNAINLPDTGLSLLFPPAAEEPVKTWETVFNTHPDANMRFTAFLLALANFTATAPQETA